MPTLGKQVTSLVRWFERSQRVLPWRDQPTPYRVWVSEIMLQQTQVVTVIPYFERFMAAFESVEKLAAAPIESVYAQWAGLGYYSRARNLHKAAQNIVARGGFGRTREEWLEMPGVGPYTAGAICSIALNLPEAILDGNVERVMSRLFTLARGELGESAYKEVLWSHAREWVNEAHARGLSVSALNQGLMELGAMVCTPKSPRCGVCPLRAGCGAYLAERVNEFPQKKARAKKVNVSEERECLIYRKAGQAWVLLERAREGEWRAGLWDLPLKAQPILRTKTKVKSASKNRNDSIVVTTKHIVTHHAIERKTRVTVTQAPLKKPVAQLAGEASWVKLPQILENREVALGSAAKKSLMLVWAHVIEKL